MKKILVVLTAAVAMLTACKKTSDFNKYLVPDYEFVQAQYEGHEVVFYEAELTLNGSPVELGLKAEPVSVREVFQLTDTALVVFVDRNYADGTVAVEQHEGYWCEDVVVDPTGIADFNDALKALLGAKDLNVPDAIYVTLRNPLGPVVYENPFYIFGSNHANYVAVDAVTLDVQGFESAVESSLAEKFPICGE